MEKNSVAALASLLLAASCGAAPLALLHSNLVVKASVAVPGVFRLDVSPAAGEEGTPDTDTLKTAGSALQLDRTNGVVRLLDDAGRPAWEGRFRPLRSYGRARVPGLEVAWKAAPGEAIYGLGERFDALNQYGRACEMWIRDEPGQDHGRATYCCSPVVFSTVGYGLFAGDNPEGDFDFNTQREDVHRYRRAGERATFYLAGGSLNDLLLKRAKVQGPFRGIPEWAWGLWISRNSYEHQDEAEAAIRGMLERGIPFTAIVQEAWKGRSEEALFNSFSTSRWPRLDQYFALCASNGIRTVLWEVPVLYHASPKFEPAAKAGHLVKAADGSPRMRRHWLAGFGNFDFTSPDAVKSFKDLLRPVVARGVRGFKADDGEDIEPEDVFADGRRGWEMHNEYPVLFQRALAELFREEGVEGVLWSRSGSLGMERTPALWAGDQYGNWEQLRSLVPAGLSAGLSGMPFWGHDIGGYIGTPSAELYIRWAQFGAFCPLMQFHGQTPREPWNFGPEAEQAFKRLALLRMNLRPTLMELGREAGRTGLPIMRPMILEFPGDARFLSEETQYMLGPNLLVAPVLAQGARERAVKFPEGKWRHLLDGTEVVGPKEAAVPAPLDTPCVYVRKGAKLRVELDPDAHLGEWHPGAPVRTTEF